jgi:DNA-binding transcriptional ArsR family regulator
MEHALTRTLQALADPTRRAILQLLSDGDRTAGAIAAHFAISAPSVSHHLSVLKQAELVYAQRSGQHIIYRLNTTVAQETLQQLMDLLRIGGAGGSTAVKEDRDA